MVGQKKSVYSNQTKPNQMKWFGLVWFGLNWTKQPTVSLFEWLWCQKNQEVAFSKKKERTSTPIAKPFHSVGTKWL